MKNRDIYLNQLIDFQNKPLIKVITGMRRCGKSSLLDLFEKHLLENNIKSSEVIRINFESLEFDSIKNYMDLYLYIKARIPKSTKAYILLDEVQQVEFWEKAVNSFLVDFNVDIYITGSNAYLLSSELSTMLSGRYVEIKMLPLSFREFIDFNTETITSDSIDDGARRRLFKQYLEYGSLPAVYELMDHPHIITPFLLGIYNTVIMKDVVQRNTIRDVSLLESLVRFIVQNIGSPVSTKKISDYLTSAGRKTSSETIDNYLIMLENAYIIYKARRYDLKGKLHLKTLEKYYIVDTGIRNAILGYRDADYGHILENIVYFELIRRGFEVSTGKVGNLEVDFVAVKPDKKAYYQVAASISDESVRERELRSLQAINDNYEKVILTMDDNFIREYEGIKSVNLIDFLLNMSNE